MNKSDDHIVNNEEEDNEILFRPLKFHVILCHVTTRLKTQPVGDVDRYINSFKNKSSVKHIDQNKQKIIDVYKSLSV